MNIFQIAKIEKAESLMQIAQDTLIELKAGLEESHCPNLQAYLSEREDISAALSHLDSACTILGTYKR